MSPAEKEMKTCEEFWKERDEVTQPTINPPLEAYSREDLVVAIQRIDDAAAATMMKRANAHLTKVNEAITFLQTCGYVVQKGGQALVPGKGPWTLAPPVTK